MSQKGLKLAVKYSYRPFILGFCGPQKNQYHKILTNYLLGAKVKNEAIEAILHQFVGAFPYYVLIAWKNNIKDVFDHRVVEAYWLGNSLLYKVKRQDIGVMIITYFLRLGWIDMKRAKEIISSMPQGVKPHHTFHVFFMGSVTDTIQIKGRAIDRCRIGWGEVTQVKKEKLMIKANSLSSKSKLRLQAKEKFQLPYETNFTQKIKKGDRVTYHWGMVVDKINKRQKKNLEKYTKLNLKLYNASQKK
ncbi:MAG: DUF6390 family protein [Patescibacteria group bacterium]|nr:DUF6390 family protein [Patescibacteria group bacterium]